MASPECGQNTNESPDSWIRRLPAEIRHDIMQSAIKTELAWGYSQPTTYGQIWMRESDTINAGNSNPSPEKQYWAKAYRTVSRHESLQPLLELSKTTREAVLGTEVFSFAVRKDGRSYTDPRYHQFGQNGPPLPVFAGATQELVLQDIGRDITAKELFLTLRHIFGTKIRRIHVSGAGQQWHAMMFDPGVESVTSAQTGRAYLSRKHGELLGVLERDLFHVFRGILTQPFTQPCNEPNIETEFKEEDARVFRIGAIAPHYVWADSPYDPSDLVQICEVVRQHSDGRLMINNGLKYDFKLEEQDTHLSTYTRLKLREMVRIAKELLPDLEYISVCVRLLDSASIEKVQSHG